MNHIVYVCILFKILLLPHQNEKKKRNKNEIKTHYNCDIVPT